MRIGTGIATGLCLVLLSSCGSNLSVEASEPRRTASALYEVYRTVAKLAKVADTIVVAELGTRVEKVVDHGGGDASLGGGVPMAFHGYVVQRSLAGTVEPGTEILVGGNDDEKVLLNPGEPSAALGSGSATVLLFLEELIADEAPDVAGFGTVYIPLSAANGVFELDESGNEVTPRHPVVTSLERGRGRRSEHQGWPTTDVMATIAASRKQGIP